MAISNLADGLKKLSGSMASIGLDTEGVRGSVMGSEQWQGGANEKWYAVVTERVGDAGLTNDVMGSAAVMLSGLAADIEAERRVYDRLAEEQWQAALSQGTMPGLTEPPGVANPEIQRAMDACAARAAGLLEQAAGKLLSYAALAEDIRARPAGNRTPGVPSGVDRSAASLQLLTILFGSVVGNRAAGSKFEQAVLQSLGITKNNDVWRPDPAFEGKLTAGGLARGVIVDGKGPNFLLEVKGTKDLQLRYQIRAEMEQARLSGRPLWIIKDGEQKADPGVVRAAEQFKGGVLYTRDDGKTFTDGNGNPVQASVDKSTGRLEVSGYQRSAPVGGGDGLGPAGSPDPGAPSSPVRPDVAEPPPAADVPDVPVEPEIPDIPEPEIFP